ncbi:C4b-binding protein alpha chain-like [Engystomops pustulosus]|uniref:C4b-binding protein alpha chain-like n=1 Tax=Engystomops pustulosus TaxID=76066 RepID=UPI003AFAD618
MNLLRIIRSSSILLFMLILAHCIARSHAQAALDDMDLDPQQPCKDDDACGEQTQSEKQLTENFCGPLPRNEHGQPKDEYMGKDSFPIGSKIKYVCRPGFSRIPGIPAEAICMADATWSLPEIFCKPRSCGNPGEADNAEMQADDFTFGSRVTYVCNLGYVMTSKRNYRICQADGTWSNERPYCEVVICKPPDAIPDGDYYPVKEYYSYLDSVKYTCTGKINLIGEHTISCTAEGTWSAEPPKCKEVRCPYPFVENAVKESGFSGPYVMNSAVRFKCKTQYQMFGFNIVKCNQDSKWEPELPKCVGLCLSVPKFIYAELEEPTTNTSFLEGTTLKYKCKEGFDPIPGAVNTVTCKGLKWSVPDVFCKAPSCKEPEPVPHSIIISGSFEYGKRIIYECETGYKHKNVNYRECQIDGSWSLPIPECEGFCNAPPKLDYAELAFQYENVETFFAGTKVQYTCKPGYYRVYNFSNEITCLGNLTWSKITNEFCKIRTCPTPKDLNDGWYDPEREQYISGDTITYTCHEGYQLVGKASLTCQPSGIWNIKTPECKAICDDPPALEYAELDSKFKDLPSFIVGNWVKYKCRPGYFPNGKQDKIFCLYNSMWSKALEFCYRRSCGRPPKAENTVTEGKDYLFESEVTYKCKEGYKMVSKTEPIKCGSNGKWNGVAPICEAKNCSSPEDLKDGTYWPKKAQYTYSESVVYKCNELQLVGADSVSCTVDGTWSAGAPKCEEVCVAPPELDFAEVKEEFKQQKYFDKRTSVKYQCRPGFHPVPGKDNELKCKDNLRWSPYEKFCTEISCGDPGDIHHGKKHFDNFLFGSRVNYTCNPGYSMVSKINYRECQADGAWSGRLPKCKEPECDRIWELQEEARKCTSTPDEWLKYLQVQYLYLQIENLKMDIEMKKKELRN